jgi:ComF family protein
VSAGGTPLPAAAVLLRRWSRGVAGGLVDLLFPPTCLACRAAIGRADALCAPCWSAVRFIERPFCERLGTPFATDFGAADLGIEGLLSPEAMADPPVYARARAVAHFDDGPVRHLVHRLKYGDRLELAGAMGRWMARAGEALLAEADVLVPVPLHPRRLAMRGYNQSALLARVVSRHCGVPAAPVALARRRATPAQVGLSRSQRALNMQGAFKVPEAGRPEVQGRAVVLIDDVLTSGATANAAARALLRGGARQVDVLVFGRVTTGVA